MASNVTVFPSTGEEPHRMKPEGNAAAAASAAVAEKSRVTTEVCRVPSAATVVEVEQVRCECCGLAEECTPAYISHVRELYCGRWICGLCAEAVKEERGRAGGRLDGEGLEDALQAHMSFCMQFNEPEKTSPVVHLAAAMRRLLRRNLDGSSGTRSAPSSPMRPPISRTNSCLTSFPREFETSL